MLQAERLSTTKEAMSSYVQITMEEMAELVDLQMSSELMPTIDSVHALDRCMPLIGACPRSAARRPAMPLAAIRTQPPGCWCRSTLPRTLLTSSRRV